MKGKREIEKRLVDALWRVYRRPERPSPWQGGGNLPWDDPDFSRRMLAEHLDDSHGAASRSTAERRRFLTWLWERQIVKPGQDLLDITCGPGLYAVPLAERGLRVTGIDFAPAAIAHARALAQAQGVGAHCVFEQTDIRQWEWPEAAYDTALFLYGQASVFPREETAALLARAARALKPGGVLLLELLDPERVDRENSTWWFTEDRGLWGERPFLHLGERFWDAGERLSAERFTIIHLETGAVDEIILNDQLYEPEEMSAMLRQAGLATVEVVAGGAIGALYDQDEWLYYEARKA